MEASYQATPGWITGDDHIQSRDQEFFNEQPGVVLFRVWLNSRELRPTFKIWGRPWTTEIRSHPSVASNTLAYCDRYSVGRFTSITPSFEVGATYSTLTGLPIGTAKSCPSWCRQGNEATRRWRLSNLQQNQAWSTRFETCGSLPISRSGSSYSGKLSKSTRT